MDFGHFSVEVRAKPSGIRVTNARTGFVRIGCLFWKKTLLQSLCFFPSRFLCDGYQTWSRTEQYAVMRRSTLWDVVVWSSSFQYLVVNSNALQYGLVLFIKEYFAVLRILQYIVVLSSLYWCLVLCSTLQCFLCGVVLCCALQYCVHCSSSTFVARAGERHCRSIWKQTAVEGLG